MGTTEAYSDAGANIWVDSVFDPRHWGEVTVGSARHNASSLTPDEYRRWFDCAADVARHLEDLVLRGAGKLPIEIPAGDEFDVTALKPGTAISFNREFMFSAQGASPEEAHRRLEELRFLKTRHANDYRSRENLNYFDQDSATHWAISYESQYGLAIIFEARRQAEAFGVKLMNHRLADAPSGEKEIEARKSRAFDSMTNFRALKSRETKYGTTFEWLRLPLLTPCKVGGTTQMTDDTLGRGRVVVERLTAVQVFER